MRSGVVARFLAQFLDQFLAEHRGDELGFIDPGQIEVGHIGSVAQDRGPVTHLENLTKPMRDEQNRPTPVLPLPHHAKHVLGLVGGERRRDLIQHQKLGVVGQRPSEVEQSQHGQRYVAHQQLEVDVAEVHALEPRHHIVGAESRDAQVLGRGSDRGSAMGPGTRWRSRRTWHRSACGGARARRARDVVPASAVMTPERILTSVLFPAPLAPSSAWISPGCTVRSAERSATTGP